MTATQAIDYIHSVAWNKSRPGLSRIRHLTEALGSPEQELKFIHVAGTNGKGSVCAMLDSILRAQGLRVGLYTSPYIRRFNERMQVNGQPIADEVLSELTELIRPIADDMEDKPTEFELITAIAFEYFRRERCDIVVLEVGLGGRLDSTNIIQAPMLSIITGIDFDHTALLGNTIQAIAAEKAGIIKEGRPCLYGGQSSSAGRTIRQIAELRNAPYYTVDRSECLVKESTLDGTVFDFGELKDLRLSLLGAYQQINVAIVLHALNILENEGVFVSEDSIRRGLSSVRWPARFELCRKDPIVICDGGHNPQGVAAAVASIEQYFPEQKVNILIGVMEDKNYDVMIEELKKVAYNVFTVRPANPRALDAERFAEDFRRHKIPATAFDRIEAGVAAALEASRRENRPLVCLGSLYLYNSIVDLF